MSSSSDTASTTSTGSFQPAASPPQRRPERTTPTQQPRTPGQRAATCPSPQQQRSAMVSPPPKFPDDDDDDDTEASTQDGASSSTEESLSSTLRRNNAAPTTHRSPPPLEKVDETSETETEAESDARQSPLRGEEEEEPTSPPKNARQVTTAPAEDTSVSDDGDVAEQDGVAMAQDAARQPPSDTTSEGGAVAAPASGSSALAEEARSTSTGVTLTRNDSVVDATAMGSPNAPAGTTSSADDVADTFGFAECPAQTAAPIVATASTNSEDFIATMRNAPSATQTENRFSSGGAKEREGTRAPSFKLSEAPIARSHTLDNLMSRSAALASPTRGVACPPMQVKPSAVKPSASAQLVSRPADVMQTLPDPLPMPFHLRCALDQKLNSVCSRCHFKWINVYLKQRTEKVQQFVATQPESSRILVLFSSVASGKTEFVESLVDTTPEAVHWSTHFSSPQPKHQHLVPKFKAAGRVNALHVAMACDNVSMARALIDRGATFRRSEGLLTPMDMLEDPSDPKWVTALNDLDRYKVHSLCERSKTLRQEGRTEEAVALYQEALELQPSSEHALCGLAKMAFDAGDFHGCIKQCDAILARPAGEVTWSQFSPQTVEVLRRHCTERMHEVGHQERGSTLRSCGCVRLENIRIRVRRIPFDILSRSILPFLDCFDCVNLSRIFRRLPYWLYALESNVAALRPEHVSRWVISEKDNYDRITTELRRSIPDPNHKTTEAPAVYRGFRIFALATFELVHITAYAELINAKYKEKTSWFKKKDQQQEPKTLWFAKRFQLIRVKLGEPWTVSPAGDWEPTEPPKMPSTASSPNSKGPKAPSAATAAPKQ